MKKVSLSIATSRLLTVGEVAQRTGVPVSTIHFYESKGLITSTRNSGNQRRFAAVTLRYIAVIKVAQRVGIALEDIKQMFSRYPAGSKLSAEQWHEMSSHWRSHLDRRITLLERLRDELDFCIGCGCLSLDKCPLHNAQDKLGQEGSGARILERP